MKPVQTGLVSLRLKYLNTSGHQHFLFITSNLRNLIELKFLFFFLSGFSDIVPVKMDLNREIGMTTMTKAPTNHWSEAATKAVQVHYLKIPSVNHLKGQWS